MENKQITKKLISSNEINLKDFKFKIVDLSTENLNYDYDYLTEDLNQTTESLFLGDYKNKSLIPIPLTDYEFKSLNIELEYNLSYSQGSFFSFSKLSLTNEIVLKLCGLNLKENENFLNFLNDYYSFNYSYESYRNNWGVDYEFLGDYDLKELELKEDLINLYEEKIKGLTESLKESLEDIFKFLEKKGYESIESYDTESILRNGFQTFLNENGLNCELEIYDLNYSTEKKRGFIKICDCGDTSLKGLWIKPFKIKESQFKTTYKEFEREVL